MTSKARIRNPSLRGGNHIHSVWRDPADDFGRDLLAHHYGASH